MRKLKKISLIFFIIFCVVQVLWIGAPVFMAALWSLVDVDTPWSYPDVFPKKLSFSQWSYAWNHTNLKRAMITSYTVATLTSIFTLIISLPTAYILGRKKPKGRRFIETILLLPIVLPGMVIALFVGRIFTSLGLVQSMYGIVMGHILLGIPYMTRLLTSSFEAIPQDVLDAAEDLGTGRIRMIFKIYFPMIRLGFIAGTIFVFIKSIEEFNLSFILGLPTYETIPTMLYTYLGYNFHRTYASIISLILTVPNLIILLLIEQKIKKSLTPAAATGKG